MECWAARSGDREIVAEFPVTDLGFQGCFSTGLGAELSFCLLSISPFHNLLSPKRVLHVETMLLSNIGLESIHLCPWFFF
jgi:hypothetical protein